MTTNENPNAGDAGASDNLTGSSIVTDQYNPGSTPQTTPDTSVSNGDAVSSPVGSNGTRAGGLPAPLQGYRNLTHQHAQELYASAIPPEIAEKHGVRSALTRDDLPEWARWIYQNGVKVFPVLNYPMAEPDGRPTGQVKPQKDTVRLKGEPAKYLSPNDQGTAPYAPQFPVVREVSNPKGVLVVEGVKQALAADAWAPADWSIYRIAGITGWSRGGVPTPYLSVVRGLDVIVIPDADAATKYQVYNGAVELGKACEARRAKSVKFVRIAGFGSVGVDDQLGTLTGDDERRQLFEDWIATAKPKPADTPPKPRTAAQKKADAAQKKAAQLAETRRNDSRPIVHIHEDRKDVIDRLDTVLRARFDGTELFRHGESLGRLVTEEKGPKIATITPGAFNDLVTQSAITVTGEHSQDDEEGCCHPHVWPDANTLKALESRYRAYQPLDGVSAVPVVRRNGSIVTETGYDPETRIYVDLADDIAGIEVPDSPTDADIAAARSLLIDDMLVDFLMKDQSDRAHAVAALLSPLIRPLVPTCPGLVINGLQPGVGKGLAMATISTVVSGTAPQLAMLPDNDDEMRKTLTAYLHAGKTSIFFDETHKLASAVLNGCITAESWSDRKLGVTERIEMPNKACLYFAGNQIEISGDMARRAVQIRLHTDEPDPQNRDGFKHELPTWAVENRAALLRACLILVRAWFDRGQPEAPRTFRFGSFEKWQDVIGGILHVAGIPGFLEGMDEQRKAADFEGQFWSAHLAWLADKFGVGVEFTAKKAGHELLSDEDAEPPFGLESLTDKPDARALGKAWATQADRWRSGLRIVKIGAGQGGRTKWAIEEHVASQAAHAAPPATAPPAPAPTPVASCQDCGGTLAQHPKLPLVTMCPACFPTDFEEVA